MTDPSTERGSRKLRYHNRVAFYDAEIGGFLSQLGTRHGEVGVHVEASLRISERSKRNPDYQKYLFEVIPFDYNGTTNTATQEVISYGDKVRLRHVYTQQYLCVKSLTMRISSSWEGESDNLKLSLEDADVADVVKTSHFRIMPSFRVRQEGQPIEADDEVVIQQTEVQPLHFISTSQLGTNEVKTRIDLLPNRSDEYYEANLSVRRRTYAVRAYDSIVSDDPFLESINAEETDVHNRSKPPIKVGDAILLFHKDYDAFVNIKSGLFTMHRVTNSTQKLRSYLSNSLFTIELQDTDRGGSVTIETAIRIRHLASGLYLWHDVDGLSLTSNLTEDSTLWLMTMQITAGLDDGCQFIRKKNEPLIRDSVVRIAGISLKQSVATATCWLGTESSGSTTWESSLSLCSRKKQVFQDAFQVIAAPQLDLVHEIQRIIAAKPTISEYVNWWLDKDNRPVTGAAEMLSLQKLIPKEGLMQAVLYHLTRFVKLLTPPGFTPLESGNSTLTDDKPRPAECSGNFWTGVQQSELHMMYQQTMLDQEMHEMLMACVTVPFSEVPWAVEHLQPIEKIGEKKYCLTKGRFRAIDLGEQQNKTFKNICTTVYSALLSLVRDNGKAAVALAQPRHLKVMREQLTWYQIRSDLCLEEILKHQQVLNHLDDDLIPDFCSTLSKLSVFGERESGSRLYGQKPADGECVSQRIVQLLNMCCVCYNTDEEIPTNQTQVAKYFLTPLKNGNFPKGLNIAIHKIGIGGRAEVRFHPKDSLWLPVRHVSQQEIQNMQHEAVPIQEFAEKSGNSQLMSYNVACIELFGALIRGRFEFSSQIQASAAGNPSGDPVVDIVKKYFGNPSEFIPVLSMLDAQKAGGTAGPGKAAQLCPAYATLTKEWLSAPSHSDGCGFVIYCEYSKGGNLRLAKWNASQGINNDQGPSQLSVPTISNIKEWIRARASDLSFLLQNNQTMKLLLSSLKLCRQLIISGYYAKDHSGEQSSSKYAHKPLFNSLLSILDPSTDGKHGSNNILTAAQRRQYCTENLPLFKTKLEVVKIINSTIDECVWKKFVPRVLGIHDSTGNDRFWKRLSFSQQYISGCCVDFFNENEISNHADWLKGSESSPPFNFAPSVSPERSSNDGSIKDLTSHLMELMLYQWQPMVEASLGLLFRLHAVPMEVSSSIDKVVTLEHRNERKSYHEIEEHTNILLNKHNDVTLCRDNDVESNKAADLVIKSLQTLCDRMLEGSGDLSRKWAEFQIRPANTHIQRLVVSTDITTCVLAIISTFLRFEESHATVPSVIPFEEVYQLLIRQCYRFLAVLVKNNPTASDHEQLLSWCSEEKLKLHIRHERRPPSESSQSSYERLFPAWEVSSFFIELMLHYQCCVYFSTCKDLIWTLASQLSPGALEGTGRSPRHLRILRQMILVKESHYTTCEHNSGKVMEVTEKVIDSNLATVLAYLVAEKKRVLIMFRDSNGQEREIKEKLLKLECDALKKTTIELMGPTDRDGILQYHIELVELFACGLKGNISIMSPELVFDVLWPVYLPTPMEYSYPLFFLRPYLLLLSCYINRDDKYAEILTFTGPVKTGNTAALSAQTMPFCWSIVQFCGAIVRALSQSEKPGSQYLLKCYEGTKCYSWLSQQLSTNDKTVLLPKHLPVWFNKDELEIFTIEAIIPFLAAVVPRVTSGDSTILPHGALRKVCRAIVQVCSFCNTQTFQILHATQRAVVRQLLVSCSHHGLVPERVELGNFEATDQPQGFLSVLKKSIKKVSESLLEASAAPGCSDNATSSSITNGGSNGDVAVAFKAFRTRFRELVYDPSCYNSKSHYDGPETPARLLAFSGRLVNSSQQYLLREYLCHESGPTGDDGTPNPTMMTLENFSIFADLLVSETLSNEHVAGVLDVMAHGFAESWKVGILEVQRVKLQGIQSDLAKTALDIIEKRKGEIQLLFNRKKATQKIFILMEISLPRQSAKTREIQVAAVNLLKNLLDGGLRGQVQRTIHQFFVERSTEGFFVFCREQLKGYELELKSWDLQTQDCSPQYRIRLSEMETFLRTLQLLCEGHMTKLQNYLREQLNNPFSINVVREVAMFVRYIAKELTHKSVLSLIRQGFITLTEFCQGPCKGNQETLVEAKMPSVVGDLLERSEDDYKEDSTSDGTTAFDDVLSDAISMLLSLTEGVTSVSSDDCSQAQHRTDVPKKLLNMLRDNNQTNLHNLLSKMNESWIKGHIVHVTKMSGLLWQVVGKVSGDEEISAEEDGCHEELQLGFNIFIFIHSLCRFDKVKGEEHEESKLLKMLKNQMSFAFFNEHVGQIEIGRDERLEKVYFVLPDCCKLLPEESKSNLQIAVKRDSRETKIQDFFLSWSDLAQEITIYSEASKQANLKLFIKYGTYLADISLFLSLVISAYLMMTMKRKYGPSKGFLSHDHYIGFNVLAFIQIFVELWLFFGWMQIKGRVIVLKHVQRIKHEMSSAPWGSEDNNQISERQYADWARHSSFTKVYLSLVVLLRHQDFYRTLLFAAAAPVGYFGNPIFFSIQIFRVIERSDSLQNVIKSVTSKYQDLLWTAGLGLVVIFLFSMCAFYYFSDKYYDVERNPDLGRGFSCQELWKCFILNVAYGLRQGGGLADVLQHPDWHGRNVWTRLTFDFLFWLVMIIIFLNIIFGIILDTFAELRDKKQDRERDMKSRCFICGKEAYEFDKSRRSSFANHYKRDHNMWDYLFFYVYLFQKSHEDFTGQESWVYHRIERNLTDFFPEDAIALEEEPDDDEAEEEEREKRIESKLDKLIKLIKNQRPGTAAPALPYGGGGHGGDGGPPGGWGGDSGGGGGGGGGSRTITNDVPQVLDNRIQELLQISRTIQKSMAEGKGWGQPPNSVTEKKLSKARAPSPTVPKAAQVHRWSVPEVPLSPSTPEPVVATFLDFEDSESGTIDTSRRRDPIEDSKRIHSLKSELEQHTLVRPKGSNAVVSQPLQFGNSGGAPISVGPPMIVSQVRRTSGPIVAPHRTPSPGRTSVSPARRTSPSRSPTMAGIQLPPQNTRVVPIGIPSTTRMGSPPKRVSPPLKGSVWPGSGPVSPINPFKSNPTQGYSVSPFNSPVAIPQVDSRKVPSAAPATAIRNPLSSSPGEIIGKSESSGFGLAGLGRGALSKPHLSAELLNQQQQQQVVRIPFQIPKKQGTDEPPAPRASPAELGINPTPFIRTATGK